MATFKFELHEKVTLWKKTEFEIEANSLDEANELAIKFHVEGKTQEIEWDDIEGSEEILLPSDNDGEATAEIKRIDVIQDVNIWNNVEKTDKLKTNYFYELHVLLMAGVHGYSFGIKSNVELDEEQAIEKAKELKKFEEIDDYKLVDTFEEIEEENFKNWYPKEYNS